MEKIFNTAGPVNQPEHYKIDPLHRWDLGAILMELQQRLEAAGLDAHGLAEEQLNADAYLSSNEAGSALR